MFNVMGFHINILCLSTGTKLGAKQNFGHYFVDINLLFIYFRHCFGPCHLNAA